jgi:hypothetical protein
MAGYTDLFTAQLLSIGPIRLWGEKGGYSNGEISCYFWSVHSFVRALSYSWSFSTVFALHSCSQLHDPWTINSVLFGFSYMRGCRIFASGDF